MTKTVEGECSDSDLFSDLFFLPIDVLAAEEVNEIWNLKSQKPRLLKEAWGYYVRGLKF